MNREGQDQLHQLHVKLNQPLYRKVSLAGENLYNQLKGRKKIFTFANCHVHTYFAAGGKCQVHFREVTTDRNESTHKDKVCECTLNVTAGLKKKV